jgi:predicted nuclease of predicted toxin-antitoxin system
LSPAIAAWLSNEFGVAAVPLRDLGLRDAEDPVIFAAARIATAVIMTKDYDFVQLLERLGPPLGSLAGIPRNARMRELLHVAWPRIRELLDAGESLVEISEPSP